jgi:signal transduction histidine kinase
VRHSPADSEIDVRIRAADGEATLSVIDDGPGIPDGLEEQIFERFVRGSGPADTAPLGGTGTGLGLAIVRAVAEAHGGSVEGGREPGRGARFTVRLPLSDRAPLATV